MTTLNDTVKEVMAESHELRKSARWTPDDADSYERVVKRSKSAAERKAAAAEKKRQADLKRYPMTPSAQNILDRFKETSARERRHSMPLDAFYYSYGDKKKQALKDLKTLEKRGLITVSMQSSTGGKQEKFYSLS